LIQKFTYCVYVVLATVVFSSCGFGKNELPPLDETYSQKDKNAFGSFVLHEQLQHLFYHNNLRPVKTNFENTWRDISDTGAVYINISKNLFLSDNDLAGMLAYVANGNSLFISSNNIDEHLLDTLGCQVVTNHYRQTFSEMKKTSVNLFGHSLNDSAAFQYFYIPFYNHFTKRDTLYSRELGSNFWGTNYIVVFYGKGRFYLHTDPRAFSNYFLLQKDNYKYFQQVFSFTPAIPEHVYWDDYYNRKNYPKDQSGNKTGLAVLLQYPAMSWAFWLLMLLFGLYILFGGKRRQRIIDPILPNANTTVAFTETISRLYLQQKDNRNIAEKLSTYLLEHIRNQYYLNTSHINDEFISTLSRKSNNTKEGTEKLFKLINVIHQSMEVSEQQLLLLNQQIENFYKNKL
jgi:hypothetical protein